MFDSLTDRLQDVFKRLRGHAKLSEKQVQEVMREIRLALLEADVNFKVAKEFVSQVQERAVGQEVLQSLTPAQQVIKIVNEEMVELLGSKENAVNFSGKLPVTIMLIGLQGSGKTTAAAKLARHLKSKGRSPMLVAADVYRPAAVEQLKVLGEKIGVEVTGSANQKPLDIVEKAVKAALKAGHDTVIIDTAGRLHIDSEMMQEISQIKKRFNPQEILLTVDAMTGQDAVNVALAFKEQVDFDGIVLTKLDGDARGGAALSMRAVTGKPIKFASVGEKLEDLEPFYPDRMASRILGMGDMLSLIEKAQSAYDENKAAELERKLRKQQFTLEDFLDQMQELKKMGPLDQLLGMVPGLGQKMKGVSFDEGQMKRVEAIIQSMTRDERVNPNIIGASRRKRIAAGSGTTTQDVNRLLQQFKEMQKLMKQFGKLGGRKASRAFPFQM